jgi:hypothetical protein
MGNKGKVNLKKSLYMRNIGSGCMNFTGHKGSGGE